MPPALIEGRLRAVLAVRDLGSGDQRLFQPVESEGAWEVVEALDVRFRVDGAPLVLKSDNGSAFIAEDTGKLLASHGVIQLLSPPGLPQYNGSVESGIGALKDRTTWKVALSGRHEEWTCEDLEAARVDANEMPRGPGIPARGDVWRSRPPITSEMRAAFQATVAVEKAQARAAISGSGGGEYLYQSNP